MIRGKKKGRLAPEKSCGDDIQTVGNEPNGKGNQHYRQRSDDCSQRARCYPDGSYMSYYVSFCNAVGASFESGSVWPSTLC